MYNAYVITVIAWLAVALETLLASLLFVVLLGWSIVSILGAVDAIREWWRNR